MSGEVLPWLGLVVTLMGALIGLVWRAAVLSTRVDTLERAIGEVAELRKHLWTLDRRSEVRAARASAGQFDQGNSDPPPEAA